MDVGIDPEEYFLSFDLDEPEDDDPPCPLNSREDFYQAVSDEIRALT